MTPGAGDEFGVAVIGLDHWYNAEPFIEQIVAHPRYRLVVVAHGDAERAAASIGRAGQGYATADFARAFADPGVNLVACFTTVDRNAEMCRIAAAHGKHVLSGKPMGMSVAEAESVLSVAETAGTLVFPFEAYGRATNLYRSIKRWIDEGSIGELLTIECRHDAALPMRYRDDPTPGWWTKSEHNPGGGWIDHAIYQIDAIRYLTGEEIRSSEGKVARLRHRWLPFEDYGAVEFQTVSGLPCVSRAHWLVPQGTFRRQVDVVGAEGLILYDSLTNTVRLRTTNNLSDADAPLEARLPRVESEPEQTRGWHVFHAQSPGAPGLLDHVADVLEGRESPVASARDGVANLAAALGFYAVAGHG